MSFPTLVMSNNENDMNSLPKKIGGPLFSLSMNSNSNANHSFLNKSLDILSSPSCMGIFDNDHIQEFGPYSTNGSLKRLTTISVEGFCKHVGVSDFIEVIKGNTATFKSNKPYYQLLLTITHHDDKFTKAYMYIEPTIVLESKFLPDGKKHDYAENAITVARFNKEIFYQIRARDCIFRHQNNNPNPYYVPQIFQYGMVNFDDANKEIIDAFKAKRGISTEDTLCTINNLRMIYVTMENISGSSIQPEKEILDDINNILNTCGIYHNDLTTLGNIIDDKVNSRLVILDFGEASYKRDNRRNPFRLGGKRKSTKKYKRFHRSKRNKNTHKRK